MKEHEKAEIRKGILENTKLKLTTTNWQYKGLRIYRDPEGNFYIKFHSEIYPINFSDLPKTIQYDKASPVKDYTVHGKIGRDQE